MTADFDLLLSNFQDFVGDSFQTIILVIDGLDEVSSSEWACITHALLTLRHKCQMLKIMVSSRNELPIARAFEDLPSYHIMEADVAADITSYIVGEVTESVKRRKLKLREPGLQNLIQDTLSRDANGMFQWVTCQINALCKLRNDKAIRAALMNLPRTLQATYFRILDRIEQDFPDDVHIVRRILCWLVRGVRTMTLSELAEAISIDVDGEETSMDFDAVDNDPQDILEVLSGLVTVSADAYITLSHLSVKEFLVSDNVKQNKPKFWVGHADVESELASVCLKYLCYEDFASASQDEDEPEFGEGKEDTDGSTTYAFLSYSAYSWAIHAARSEQMGNEPSNNGVVDLTMQFFHLEANYGSWLTTCRRHKLHGRLVRKKPWPLLLAASFGLTASAKLLLEDDAESGMEDGIWRCLRAAASAGHESIVALLLDHSGSDAQKLAENEGGLPLIKLNEALYLAAARGHDSVVSTLLDYGANINAIAGKEGTALQVAALEGRYGTVKLLLDRGASHGIRSKRYGTPLAAAAEKGHERTVAVLMTHGADPNGRGGWYSLPLVSAIVGKNAGVMTCLVKNGANVNARGGRLGCPLMAAASLAMDDVVKELVNQGAHVNDEDDRSSDALYSAALAGHSGTTKTLLDLGADVNALGGKYQNALGAASWEGHADVVRILLDAGADVDFCDADKGNALQLAAARGHLNITQMLVKAGMDPLANTSNKGASLCSAATSGHLAVVEYLWGLDLDVESQGEDTRTLIAAAFGNHEEIVRFVAGRMPDTLDWYIPSEYEGRKTPEACTALEAAASKGYLGVVNILLDAGDKSFNNTYDEWYGTALIASIDTDHRSIDVVRRLLDAGADPNQAAESGSPCFGLPLARAAFRNDKQVVELLLERGAELNKTFDNSATAIQMSAMHADAEVLELLIGRGADINLVPSAQDLYDTISDKDGLKDGPVSALQTAIWHGHEHLAQKLLDLGAETSVTVEDPVFQSALQVAAYRGHLSIMKMLLKKGVDVNEKGGYLGTALQAAASQDHEPAIRLLLEAGADATEHGCGWYCTPLLAISGGSLIPKQVRVMDLLFDYGLDVNMRLKPEHTGLVYLLHHAVFQQSDDQDFKFAEYLLDKGADVNACGGKGGTALQIAALQGYDDTVRFLLSRGADPNLTGGKYHTPLQAAYRRGYYVVLNVLYAHGALNTIMGGHGGSPMGAGIGCYDEDDKDDDGDARFMGCCQTLIHQLLVYRNFDVNSQYGCWGNALQNYIMVERDDVDLEYFLDAGADVNRLGGAMGTALCAAAYKGNMVALNRLIEKGAEVGIGNQTYPNPAFGAIKAGEQEALDILLARGADVKSAAGPYGYALQLAAAEAGGNLGIVRAVLRSGVPVNAPSAGRYGSALCAAAARGDELAVRFLINRGADVLTQGGIYGNALQAACLRPGTNIAELLLRKGARVNERGGRFGSPLQAAAAAGNTLNVLLLLRHGADINFQGGKYGTALQAACVSGNLMLVKLLVERGARLDLTGGHYRTPLLAAAVLDHEDITRYLLQEWDDWGPLERKGTLNVALSEYDAAVDLIETTRAELKDSCPPGADESDESGDDEVADSEQDFLPMNVEAIPGSLEPKLSKWAAVRGMSLHSIRQQLVRVESMEIEDLDDRSEDICSRVGDETLSDGIGVVADAVIGGANAQAKTSSDVVTVTSTAEYNERLWQHLTTLEAYDMS